MNQAGDFSCNQSRNCHQTPPDWHNVNPCVSDPTSQYTGALPLFFGGTPPHVWGIPRPATMNTINQYVNSINSSSMCLHVPHLHKQHPQHRETPIATKNSQQWGLVELNPLVLIVIIIIIILDCILPFLINLLSIMHEFFIHLT